MNILSLYFFHLHGLWTTPNIFGQSVKYLVNCSYMMEILDALSLIFIFETFRPLFGGSFDICFHNNLCYSFINILFFVTWCA